MINNVALHHICAVINTEIQRRSTPLMIRVLDMGCGDGQMIAFLQRMLPQLNEYVTFEIYGFDVLDSHVQVRDYFDKTFELLLSEFPHIDWKKRVVQITSTQEWPFPEKFFDYVASNQVMEHVFDHDFTFQQIRRVLKEEGIAVHLFPLKGCIYEWHLLLPFVHWIANKDLLKEYIKLCSRLGLGRFHQHLARGGIANLDEFSTLHADYMIYETNYLSLRGVYALAKRNRMRCSFRYTKEFYRNKIRQVFKRPFLHTYALKRRAFWERLLLAVLGRLSSITLILEKNNTYKHDNPTDIS